MRERTDRSSGGSSGGGRLHWTNIFFCWIAMGTSELSHEIDCLHVDERKGGGYGKKMIKCEWFSGFDFGQWRCCYFDGAASKQNLFLL